MKNVIIVLAVCILALLTISGAVIGLGDRGTLIPPPQAVTEGFVRAIATNRHSRALPYLSASLTASVDQNQLRAELSGLSPGSGNVINVKSQLVELGQNSARAIAVIETVSDKRSLEVQLATEGFLWKVTGFSRR